MRALFSVIAASSIVACSARPVDQGEAGGSDGSDGSTGTAAATTLPLDDGPVLTTSPVTTSTSTGSADQSTDDGVVFIPEPDWNPTGWECHLHAQDCERGFKCVPISEQSAWDGSRCVPVVEDPQGIGDPCQLEDPATGVDDCDWGQFCWSTDEMGMGECIGLCLEDQPDSGDYTCEDPSAEPSIGCQSCFCICIPDCDPLLQDCSEGQACYPIQDDWQCAPDASDGAGQDSPCEFINACAPGTICVDASLVPTCEPAGVGCCTAVCDLDLPDTCPGQELGMECTPWYEEGAAPPGFETVGACANVP